MVERRVQIKINKLMKTLIFNRMFLHKERINKIGPYNLVE